MERQLKVMMAVAAGSAFGMTSLAQAQSLSTALSNNGTGGVFLDLTPTSPLHFNSFDTYWSGTSTIEVYTRPGTYVGFDDSSAGWTLTQTVVATGAGTTTLAPVTLTSPILLPSGATTGVYLQPVSGGGFRYSGPTPAPQTTWSNADLTLFSDVARTGLVAFGGTRNTPRVFAGTIHYSLADPLTPGACCKTDGTCSDGTLGDCQTAGGVFQGPSSVCASVTCPQPGACCATDGTCAFGLPAACAASGGTFMGAAVTCAATNCDGACCNPDGTCTSGSQVACTGVGGIFQGLGVACASVTCSPFFVEVEPNETKANATAITFATPGQTISGNTTGSVSTAGAANSLDQFLITTPAMAVGVYRNRLTITSATEGHTGTLRGLGQTGAAAGTWPGPVGTPTATDTTVQTSSTVTNPPRMNQWYGFGKQEQIYYRVTGVAATTGNYFSTWTVDPVAVTDLGAPFNAGLISISAMNQAHTTDTDLWVYDADFNAIDGYGNDDESANGGSGGTGLLGASFLRREFAAGTYYIAMTSFNLANNKGSPCDDDFRTGALLDFPNAVLNSVTTLNQDVTFAITDSAGTSPVSATRPDAYDIVWFKMTVTGTIPTGACCHSDGTCTEVTHATCLASPGGVYNGNGTLCAAANCNGACCNQDGTCTSGSPDACSTAGGLFQGLGSTCGGVTCTPFIVEVEPNETKATATPVNFTTPGQILMGTSTGSSTVAGPASLDQFLISTPAAAPGIYRNQLTITTSGTAGHTGSIRGTGQVAATAGAWPGPVGTPNTTDTAVQTSSTVTTPARMNQWYGFGKEEQIYYRVTGLVGTTAPYIAQWTRDPVAATDIGTFLPGVIDITTFAQGHSTDTDMWVYDANFNAIPGYGNDDESVVGGSPGTGATLQSFLRREYAAGTYYIVMSNFQMANNMGSPCDDDFRTGSLLDFPDAIANSSTSTNVNVTFSVVDASGATQIAATRPAAYDVLFFKMTVAGACYANCDESTQPPVLNVADFGCFLTRYAAGEAYANCDDSTQPPVLNVADFGCFLTKYAAGCP
ncbi:MAG: hypothetical protein WD749_00835 [Phycisphaerales bacterium]